MSSPEGSGVVIKQEFGSSKMPIDIHSEDQKSEELFLPAPALTQNAPAGNVEEDTGKPTKKTSSHVLH